MREFRGIGLTEVQEDWFDQLYNSGRMRGVRRLKTSGSIASLGGSKPPSFCCLGVFADSYPKTLKVQGYKFCHSEDPLDSPSASYLSVGLARDLGLNSGDGVFLDPKTGKPSPLPLPTGGYACNVAELNDNLNLSEYPTFELIADFLIDHKEYVFYQFIKRSLSNDPQ